MQTTHFLELNWKQNLSFRPIQQSNKFLVLESQERSQCVVMVKVLGLAVRSLKSSLNHRGSLGDFNSHLPPPTVVRKIERQQCHVCCLEFLNERWNRSGIEINKLNNNKARNILTCCYKILKDIL